MDKEQLPPRMRNRPALKQYRSDLQHDPQNKAALNKIKVIETIYRQAGLPTPQ
jgi:hypothetical protein